MRRSKGRKKRVRNVGNSVPASPAQNVEPGGGRCRDLDPRCYRDDDLSEGGRVKNEGRVVNTRMRDHADERVNMNCRIETFGRVLGNFCETKRKLVDEMGMGRLFCLVDMTLPRNLCYWLATRVDVPNRKMLACNDVEFTLSPVQVQWVLGLPDGPNRLPKKARTSEMKRQIGSIWEKYHTVSGQGLKSITRRTLMQAVEGPVAAGEEDEFKRAFLMMALADVLCPTTCHRFSTSLLPVVTVAGEAADYDFCTLVLDHLMNAIEGFAKRFYPDGFANGCGGCLFFLAIFYLDRLRRPPVRWGAFPRISAWTTSEINIAKKDDLRDSGDFGDLGCYDIAYGESHPLLPRDIRPGVAEGVVRGSMDFMKIKGSGRKRRGRNCELNPHDYVVMKAARERAQRERDREGVEEEENGVEGEENGLEEEMNEPDEEENCFEEEMNEGEEEVWHEAAPELENDALGHEERVGALRSQNGTAKNSSINSRELDELMDGIVGGNPCTPVRETPYDWRSLGKGKEKVDENMTGGQVHGSAQSSSHYSDRMEECNSTNRPHQVGEGGMEEMGTPPDQTMEDASEVDGTLERSRLQRKTKSSARLSSAYVEMWRKPGLVRYRKKLSLFMPIASGQIVSPETRLIRCGGMWATAEDCASVIDRNRHVHPNFVRVVGLMYEKVWGEVFTDRSKRIMLDPEFGTEVVGSEQGCLERDAMCRAFTHLVTVPRNKVDLIFVPVLEGSHWWCAVFSIKAAEVGIIDSMDPKTAAEQHHISVLKLKYAVDTLLNLKFKTWLLGRCGAFRSYTIGMTNGGCGINSGVQMLAAIKRSAWRLKFDVYMDNLEEEESWLLSEDVLCSHNEQLTVVKELLELHMKY